MVPQPSSGRKRALAVSVAGALCLGLAGCQERSLTGPPETNYSGTIDSYLIGAVVNPVGPGKWCYTVEGFDKQYTNAPGISGAAPYPGSPDGHPSTGSFTNVEIQASGCKATVSTAGWSVTPGSNFAFSSGTNHGTSRVEFCLECDKTNGAIKIIVTDSSGNKATVGPIAGPR